MLLSRNLALFLNETTPTNVEIPEALLEKKFWLVLDSVHGCYHQHTDQVQHDIIKCRNQSCKVERPS